MLEAIYKEQRANGNRAIEALKKDFTTLRTGKVSVAILDHIFVDYYGSQTPLNQVATVLSTDAVTISITPWEKPMLKAIESAIAAANIGVNPTNDGESVKLFFPPMTVEQRQENAKKLWARRLKSAFATSAKTPTTRLKSSKKTKRSQKTTPKRATTRYKRSPTLTQVKSTTQLRPKKPSF